MTSKRGNKGAAKTAKTVVHPAPKNVVVRPNFTAKKFVEGKLPISHYARALILQGFSNADITAALKAHYRLPKKHEHYAAWYRYELIRKFRAAGKEPPAVVFHDTKMVS